MNIILLILTTCQIKAISSKVLPQSTAATVLLRSSTAGFKTELHTFKIKVINCHIRRHIQLSLSNECQRIFNDFETLFESNFRRLEDTCRILVANLSVPCYPMFKK